MKENPPIDEVFAELFKDLDKAAEPKKVVADAHDELKGRYFAHFLKQLREDPCAWAKAEANLRRTATHIGKAAAVLASFHNVEAVSALYARKAADFVEQECPGPERGRWCTDRITPEPPDLPPDLGLELERLLDKHRESIQRGDRVALCDVYKLARPLLLRLIEAIANSAVKKALQFLMKLADGCCGAPA